MIIEIAMSICAGLVTLGITSLILFAGRKFRFDVNEKATRYAVRDVVDSLTKTVVVKLRKDGKWDDEAKKTTLASAIEKVGSVLSEYGVSPNVEKIETMIESYLHNSGGSVVTDKNGWVK